MTITFTTTRPVVGSLLVHDAIDTREATVADLRAALEALPPEQQEDWCAACEHKDATPAKVTASDVYAQRAARLWKRAAKAYRCQRSAALADWAQTRKEISARDAARAERDAMREERDAAQADVDYVRQELDLARGRLRDTAQILIDGIVLADGPMNAEEAARRAVKALDDKHAKLVEVADKLRASRVDVDILQQAMARMRPVVEEACGIVGRGYGLPESFSRAVEAYRAGGEHGKVVVKPEPSSTLLADVTKSEMWKALCVACGEPEIQAPDIQRTYTPPDNDTAERIADDAASDHARPATWVVRRRIEALVDAPLRVAQRETDAYRKHFRAVASAIGANITEDEWEEMTTATAERVAAEVDAAQPEPVEPMPGAPEKVWCAPIWESGEANWDGGIWRTDRPDEHILRVCKYAEYLRADRANDPLAASQVHAALEAAAERAVEWWTGTNSSTASLRRAVMGDGE